jgi:hypothetical protein
MEVVAIVSSRQVHDGLAWMLLYVGPEVFMPFLSAVAGALGVLLVFWQRVTGLVARLWRTIFHRNG